MFEDLDCVPVVDADVEGVVGGDQFERADGFD